MPRDAGLVDVHRVDQIVHGVAVFEAVVKSAKTGQPVKVA